MATGTWGIQTSKKMFRAVIAAFFAAALVMTMVAPAAAQEEPEDGLYTGEYTDIRPGDQEVDVQAALGTAEPDEYTFVYLDDDEFIIVLSPDGPELGVEMEEWECAVEVTLEQGEDHVAVIGYQGGETSTFNIATMADLEECGIDENGNGNGEEPPPSTQEDDEHDEPQPVQPAERVDTGAGGTAGGFGAFALLFGLIAAAGATVLRRGSATS